jgi:hypothetical protein
MTTPAEAIRQYVEDEWSRSPALPTIECVIAATCQALMTCGVVDQAVMGIEPVDVIRTRTLQEIIYELRG